MFQPPAAGSRHPVQFTTSNEVLPAGPKARGRVNAMNAKLAASAILLLLGGATAQSTWVVDALNRPGTHFTDIPPAVQAAAAGDTILVREAAGFYYNATVWTNKGLALLGVDDASTPELPRLRGTLQVAQLPAGERFVLEGVEGYGGTVAYPTELPLSLSFDRCAGGVHLEGVKIGGIIGFSFPPISLVTSSIVVRDCARVSISRCAFAVPAVGLSCVNSQLLISESSISGITWSGAGSGPPYGISTSGSSVIVQDSQIAGGAGSCNTICYLGWYYSCGFPAISANNTRFTLVGSATQIRGGSFAGYNTIYCVYPACQSDSVQATGGSLLIDPGVTFVGPVNATGSVVAPVFRMVSSAASPGGTIQIGVTAPAGAVAATFVSLPGGPFAFPFGELWLEPSFMILVDAAVVGPSGTLTITRPILSLYRRSLPLAFQAGVLYNGALSLTTPSVTVLH